jgi:hypothetical protein
VNRVEPHTLEELSVYEPDWTALAAAETEDPFMDAGVELLKSIAMTAVYCAAVQDARPLDRDAAIRCGLLVRATKLGKAMVRDACRDGGEFQIGLSRMLMETLANLHYLCEDETGQRHQSYVFESLISEREFLKTIQARINTDPAGETLPVEARMLRSIEEAAAVADVRLEDVPARRNNGWPTAQARVEAAYGSLSYATFRAGSDALHGGWYDLFRSHISAVEGGFEPDFIGVRVRPQILMSAAVVMSRAALAYLDRRPEVDRRFFEPALQQLLAAAVKADAAHEDFLQR